MLKKFTQKTHDSNEYTTHLYCLSNYYCKLNTLCLSVVQCIRYDTRCHFNVQSKADISQLNLPHETNNQKVDKTEKLKVKN